MCRQADWNNVMSFAIFVEFSALVALMAIHYQHSPMALLANLCMLIKVLEPFEANIVICPAIFSCSDNPVRWNTATRIPGSKVELASYAKEWWYHMAVCCNTANSCCPFPIARLNGLWVSNTIRACNNHLCADHAYCKASL